MNETDKQALEKARIPGPATCPESGESFWAPIDKLSIALYGKSTYLLDLDSEEERHVLELINEL